jgi:hypothetical protein
MTLTKIIYKISHLKMAHFGAKQNQFSDLRKLRRLLRTNNTLAVTDSEKADTLANELSTVFIPHLISPLPLHLKMVTESLLSHYQWLYQLNLTHQLK